MTKKISDKTDKTDRTNRSDISDRSYRSDICDICDRSDRSAPTDRPEGSGRSGIGGAIADGGIEAIDTLSEGELRHARIDRLCRLADRVVGRLETAALELDSTDTQRFRHIVSSIKEIRDIQNLRSDSELREQQLKLAALERQSREEADGVDEVVVIIEGDEGFCG